MGLQVSIIYLWTCLEHIIKLWDLLDVYFEWILQRWRWYLFINLLGVSITNILFCALPPSEQVIPFSLSLPTSLRPSLRPPSLPPSLPPYLPTSLPTSLPPSLPPSSLFIGCTIHWPDVLSPLPTGRTIHRSNVLSPSLQVVPYTGLMFYVFESCKRVLLFHNGYTLSPFQEIHHPLIDQSLTPQQIEDNDEESDDWFTSEEDWLIQLHLFIVLATLNKCY